MIWILILTFTVISLVAYVVLNYIYVDKKPINRLYKFIGSQEDRRSGSRDIRRKLDLGRKIKMVLNKIRQIIRKHNIKKTKYYKKFNEQLSDAIVVISNSLKAGHSFAQALGNLVQEMPEPISAEFGKVIREVKLGKTLDDSLNNLVERMPSKDLELMITAIQIQRETGGNLSEVLDIISETIRERVKIQGEIRTLTAQGKLSAIVVSALPIALAAIMLVMSPAYILGLFSHTIGIVMVVMGILLELLGIWFISKIVKIDV